GAAWAWGSRASPASSNRPAVASRSRAIPATARQSSCGCLRVTSPLPFDAAPRVAGPAKRRSTAMTIATRPRDRIPRGDRDRRLSLGLTRDAMAAEAGITVEQLRRYESTPIDEEFSLRIAERVGLALERLEATRLPLVYNGPVP